MRGGRWERFGAWECVRNERMEFREGGGVWVEEMMGVLFIFAG